MRINTVLYRREMSPTQWLEEFRGGSYGKVLGHFKALEKIGWLRKVRSRKDVAGRGRSRDLYRATELPVIDDETWAELPLSIQVAFTARCLRHLGERIGDALARGTVDAQINSARHFACRSIRLDDEGWEVAMAILRDCFFSLAQEQLDAKVRLDTSPKPGRLMTIALAGFESPRSGSALSAGARLRAAGSDGHPPLRLGDRGDLPLSTRMAKVFADPLALQILKELEFRDMSPTQLEAKWAVLPCRRSTAGVRRSLTSAGWSDWEEDQIRRWSSIGLQAPGLSMRTYGVGFQNPRSRHPAGPCSTSSAIRPRRLCDRARSTPARTDT